MNMYTFLNTLVQSMLVIEETESLLLGIVPLLEKILRLGVKKQDVVSCSSAEDEYRTMAHTACKMVWLKNLLMEFDFRQSELIPIHCDNQSAPYTAQNLLFHKRTKHIKVDCHFVRDAWTKKVVTFWFTPSSKQFSRSSYQSYLTSSVF